MAAMSSNTPLHPLRLARWTLHPIRLPYVREVSWSDTVESAADYLLLELETTDGVRGIAEATVKPTWSGVSLRSLATTLEALFLPKLIGVDLYDDAAIARAIGPIRDNLAAKALIDNACHDLRAAVRPALAASTMPVSWTLTRAAPDAMAREAAETASRYGISTFKFKGGQGIATDLAGIAAVRDALNSHVNIYVDANWAYSPADAIPYVRELANAGCMFAEDPCELLADNSFAALQAQVPLTLLVDIACTGPRDMGAFLALGARAFSIKPARTGASAAAVMAHRAHASGAGFVVGFFGESMLGALAVFDTTLRWGDAAKAALAPPENTFFLMLREQVLSTPLIVSDGAVTLPPRAGYAALIDRGAVARFRV